MQGETIFIGKEVGSAEDEGFTNGMNILIIVGEWFYDYIFLTGTKIEGVAHVDCLIQLYNVNPKLPGFQKANSRYPVDGSFC